MSEALSEAEINTLMHKAIVDWSKIAKCNERWVSAHHYTNSHSKIILALWDKYEGCTQSDICKKSGVSKQQVSAVLKEFEKKEYITRVRYNGDERFNKVMLTEHGREVCQKVNNDFCNFFKKVLGKCTAEERNHILSALSILADIYARALDDHGY